jgi:hypothetical protein
MKRKQLTQSERAAEMAKLDLMPDKEASERTDDLMRALLARPPDPYTPKPKKQAKRSKPAK